MRNLAAPWTMIAVSAAAAAGGSQYAGSLQEHYVKNALFKCAAEAYRRVTAGDALT
jgi:hypothetical protein